MQSGYIDIYCERTGPEFWSEPLNAVTNLAFIIAALLLARRLMRDETRADAVNWMFAGLIAVIGIGSFLFHTLAVRWSMLADVLPILLFILLYTWYALRRFAGLRASVCWLGVAAVIGVAVAVPPLTGYRSGAYVSALLALLVIGGYLRFARHHPAGPSLLAAAGLFAVSLAFRTVDEPLCSALPIGTHYGWHILNAAVLYVVSRAMIEFGRSESAAAAG